MTPGLPPSISTRRLDLVGLDADQLNLLSSISAEDFSRTFGWTNPDRLFLGDESWIGPLFARRLADDEANATWLARAIIERDSATLVGHIGCHLAPSATGTVEFGYTVAQSRRRQGIASEAIAGLAAMAYATGAVRTIRDSIGTDNVASIGLITSLDFTRVGAVVDENDGPESVFERDAQDLVFATVNLRDN